jgi:phenylpropionate dioxygenase-like ring-hydroxylating dioxygenase large terminal subunit
MTATDHDAPLSPLVLPQERYPTGWFQVAWCDEIAPGTVRSARYFGENLVIWRGESGRLTVMDAYCLHLGANIGVGGTVEGDDVRCPWHGWTWDGDGCNTSIPFSAQQCKENLRIKTWVSREWYGCVLVWHDKLGRAPLWEPPVFPELEGGDEYFPIAPDMRVVHRIKAHPQMVAENSADAFHVPYVHGAGEPPEFLKFEFDGHAFRGEVAVSYGVGKESTWMTPNGPIRPVLEYNMWGVGQGAVRWPEELMSGIQYAHFTPVDDEYCDYYFCQTVKRPPGSDDTAPMGAARRLIDHQLKIIEQDFFTWENMKVLHAPNFAVEEAKYYAAFRRWAWQFYPTASA